MSNRPRRLGRHDRRQLAIDQRRFLAERYKAHGKYSARELRTILVEDAVARRVTPMAWMMQAIATIASAEKVSEEVVFTQLREQCLGLCGLDMPFGG